MVSWGYAFSRGVIIWLWAILWGLIGGAVALLLSGGVILALILNPTAAPSGWPLLGVFGGVIIGSLVASIGSYAAIVKIILESKGTQQSPAS